MYLFILRYPLQNPGLRQAKGPLLIPIDIIGMIKCWTQGLDSNLQKNAYKNIAKKDLLLGFEPKPLT